MKIIIIGLWLFSLLAAHEYKLVDAEKLWIKQHPSVSFAGDPHWLPFEGINPQGNYEGIVADHLKIVEEETGLKFVLTPVKRWTETLALSSKKKVSIISGDLADTVLKKNYKAIDPYIINPIIILMQHDENYVENLASLEKKKVVVVKGYGYTSEIFKRYPTLNFITVNTAREGLVGVSHGKYDAMLISENLATYNINLLDIKNIKIVGRTSVVMEVTLFVDKDLPLLHSILNKVMATIPLSTRENIIYKWKHQKGETMVNNLLLWFILGLVIFLFVIALYFIKQLKKSKDYYKIAIDTSADAICGVDFHKKNITFSNDAKKILGCDQDTMVIDFASWNERIHPADKIAVHQLMQENIEGSINEFCIEYRLKHNSGYWKWISIRAKTIYDRKGVAIRMDGFCNDITSVKEKQLANEENTRKLENAQEIGHLGSWEWNIITGDLTWSDEVYRIFGEEPQSFEATYEAFLSYIPQVYQEGISKSIAEAIETKKPYEYDHEIRRQDGTYRLVREAGYVVFDDKGEAQVMYGTVLDINSVVDVASTKRENKELNELLAKFDSNVIASNTDLQGIITYASKAFSDISGYTNEELVGKRQNIVRHPDTPNTVFKDLWRTIESGATWTGELKNKTKDGGFYWVLNTIEPIFNEEGVIVGYSAIRHDLTHAKAAQELHKSLEQKSQELVTFNKELEERVNIAISQSKEKDHLMAQQSKLASMGEMVGNIAHQWRQPLNALGLLIQKQQLFFERGMLTADKVNESVRKATALISKMSTTIDDFRDFFKPNKEKSIFSVQKAIENTLALIDAALYSQNIDLEFKIEPNQYILGYKNEFSQVILNLINNAKDVLMEQKVDNPTIKLATYTEGEKIIVEVMDNGGGVPSHIMEQIFEPYFTTKEEGKGTGIGLYMSKMIIQESMDGDLSVYNDDKGAVFKISVAKAHKNEL